jgi:hypothetical protein
VGRGIGNLGSERGAGCKSKAPHKSNKSNMAPYLICLGPLFICLTGSGHIWLICQIFAKTSNAIYNPDPKRPLFFTHTRTRPCPPRPPACPTSCPTATSTSPTTYKCHCFRPRQDIPLPPKKYCRPGGQGFIGQQLQVESSKRFQLLRHSGSNWVTGGGWR